MKDPEFLVPSSLVLRRETSTPSPSPSSGSCTGPEIARPAIELGSVAVGGDLPVRRDGRHSFYDGAPVSRPDPHLDRLVALCDGDQNLFVMEMSSAVSPHGKVTVCTSPSTCCQLVDLVVDDPRGFAIASLRWRNTELLVDGPEGVPASLFSGETCTSCRCRRRGDALAGKRWPRLEAGETLRLDVQNLDACVRTFRVAVVAERLQDSATEGWASATWRSQIKIERVP